jgi:hypothetical protein
VAVKKPEKVRTRQACRCLRNFQSLNHSAPPSQSSPSSIPRHRSADILSATVRATFCRPNSKEQTADRMSACRQRAACTRSVGQIPSPHLRHFPQAQFRAPGAPICYRLPCARHSVARIPKNRLRTECPPHPACSMHALRRPNPAPLFLGVLGALAVQTSSSSPRSADIPSTTVRATSCRLNSKEQTADRMSACRQRAACTRSADRIPFPHSSLAAQ